MWLGGCNLTDLTERIPPVVPTATRPAVGWSDANAVMAGICFEAAFDAAGRVFVLPDADALANLFNLADNSGLCRRPVARGTFDFANGRVLAGLWSRGDGCVARHDVIAIERDDDARAIRFEVRFVTEGACNYELVRPFWIGIDDASGYAVSIEVSSGE